jgi:hypothetical protein
MMIILIVRPFTIEVGPIVSSPHPSSNARFLRVQQVFYISIPGSDWLMVPTSIDGTKLVSGCKMHTDSRGIWAFNEV